MRFFALLAVLLAAAPAAAQDSVRVDVTVLDHDERLPDARVRLGDVEARSDSAGMATFHVPPGRYRLRVTHDHFPPPGEREIVVQRDTSLVVVLRPDLLDDDAEHDAGELETVVTATRSEQRI